ncbi:MAG TPA: hypothetical protein VIW95_04720 [Candidatus Binatus sp.]|uniref:hypothetical protein n=1 Tax=Candidatus Binatus sp. TaxID=2811406 RepID=UPI002F40BA82
MTIFDPLGLGALGCGIVVARYIFAKIEQRTLRVSDPRPSTRLPSHVDTERMVFLVFAAEWIMLAVFVFADRLPAELERFVRLGCASSAGTLILFHVRCVIRLKRLGLFDPHDEHYGPGHGAQRRARPRPRRRAHD